jgi:hypothetical protein
VRARSEAPIGFRKKLMPMPCLRSKRDRITAGRLDAGRTSLRRKADESVIDAPKPSTTWCTARSSITRTGPDETMASPVKITSGWGCSSAFRSSVVSHTLTVCATNMGVISANRRIMTDCRRGVFITT